MISVKEMEDQGFEFDPSRGKFTRTDEKSGMLIEAVWDQQVEVLQIIISRRYEGEFYLVNIDTLEKRIQETKILVLKQITKELSCESDSS